MVSAKFWCLNVMNKSTEQSLSKVFAFVNCTVPRVASGLIIAALSAGVACASSLDTLETFLKSTKSGRADFTQVVTPPAKAGQTSYLPSVAVLVSFVSMT